MWTVYRMNEQQAKEISRWQYAPPYEMYSFDGSKAVQQELLEQNYWVICEGEAVLGYFCMGAAAQVPSGIKFGVYREPRLDIGIGMRPDATGRGNGRAFFSFVLQQVQMQSPEEKLRLTVASFNKRAIALYKAFGFRQQHVFQRGDVEFQVMYLTENI